VRQELPAALGLWRCTNCGATLNAKAEDTVSDDPAEWFWASRGWQHLCRGFGPHFGSMDATRLDPADLRTPVPEPAPDAAED